MGEFFPTFTDSFLRGQNIFYGQFNDIEFYIEDTDQENLYYNILSKLFSNIKFEKIFPLNGKDNVIKECEKNINDKGKIYITDKDFDDILEIKKNFPNLFYLDCYSIENLLISRNSLYEIVKERHPKYKNNDISNQLNYDKLLDALKCLQELAILFLIIKKVELGIEFLSINTHRDFHIDTDFSYKSNNITDYKVQIENKLKQIDGRLTLMGQIKKFKKHFKNNNLCLKNIPGKYLLILINDLLKKKGLIHQYSIESFSFKLSKEVDIDNFNSLKENIEEYMSTDY